MAGRPGPLTGDGRRRRLVRLAAQALAVEPEIGGIGLVNRAQVMQVLRTWPLLAALVSREQRLAESRHRPAVCLVPGPHLRDHVGEGDAMGKAVGPDPAAAALAGDLRRDVSRLSPGDQRAGPDLTGDGGLLAAARLCAGSLLACPGGHHRAPL